MPAKLELTGQIFGRLTVLKETARPITSKSGTFWLCNCICGKSTSVDTRHLRQGNTLSCGCLQKERTSAVKFKHGQSGWFDTSKDGSYSVWLAMWKRCTNPNHKDWQYYGGKGITVCEQWKDYVQFSTDMGLRPSRYHSIDRRNSNLNYSPENCYWATSKQQSASIIFNKNWIPVVINGTSYRSILSASKILGLSKIEIIKLNELKNETLN